MRLAGYLLLAVTKAGCVKAFEQFHSEKFMHLANQSTRSAARFQNARLRGIAFFCALGVAAVFAGQEASAQTVSDGISSTQSNTDVKTEANLSSDPSASIIVQSITGGSGGRATPNAPGLPSFAGGPCLGTSVAASSALPGVSLGAGMSKEDESCQRRNWIQTLIGASQHMSPEDALIMNRLAFQIMREDKYLAGPMARVGIPSLPDDNARRGNTPKPTVLSKAAAAPAEKPVARLASVCTVIVPKSRPDAMVALLAARGCAVVVK